MKKTLLTFDWPTRHRIHLLLPLALLIAALLHGAIFFLFSVKYPISRSDGPNQARLYFLPDSSPEYFRIEAALYSSDPALFAPGRGLPELEALPSVTYTPQYGNTNLELEELPVGQLKPLAERAFKGPVQIPHLKKPKPTAQPPHPTRIIASYEIQARFQEPLDTPKFQIRSTMPLETATFMIALSPEGQVLHAIPDKTSGDSVLDDAAMSYLRMLRFLPSQKPDTTWGFIEFRWGSDVLQPAAP